MKLSFVRSCVAIFSLAGLALGVTAQESAAQGGGGNQAGLRYTPALITGAGPGGGPHVISFDVLSGSVRNNFFAYSSAFRGGATVAAGDVNNDGVQDIITGAGPGGGPHVIAFDGVALAAGQTVPLYSFFAFEGGFTGGVFVASGDVNGDGWDDMIAAAGAGGGPRVQVFSGRDGSVLQNFFAYASGFRGGVTVGSADINNDGKDDIITGAGPGGGPHVKVFSGADNSQLYSFFAFPTTFTGGVFVAGGDVSGDGVDDIIVGTGPGTSPHVRIYSGSNLNILRDFVAFDAAYVGGVRVGANRRKFGGTSPLIVGGGGAVPLAKALDVASASIGVLASVQPYPGFAGAVEVSGFAFSSRIVPTATPTAPSTPTPNVPPPPANIALSLDGIYDNGNGTFTGYIGYTSSLSSDVTIPAGSNDAAKNFFSPAPADRGQVSVFKPGVNKGAIAIIFDGNPVTYTVQQQGNAASSVTLSRDSVPRLAAVEPLAQCVLTNSDGSFAAIMGYRNNNAFPIKLPVGDLNKFEPGVANRGQPESFSAGLNNGAFTVLNFSTALTWKVATRSVKIETAATECSCPTVGGVEIKDQLNEDALALNKLADKAAALILSVGTEEADKSSRNVKKRSSANLASIEAATIQIPSLFVSCPASETPPQCVRVDNQQSIDDLNGDFEDGLHIVKRAVARANFLKTGKTHPADGETDPLVKAAEALYANGTATLAKYPRYSTSCPNE